MSRRRIAVVTTSRADYGHLRPLISELDRDPRASVSILCSGTHLSRSHGTTAREILSDGFRVAWKIRLDLEGDTPLDLSRALAQASRGFGEAYQRLKPDLVVVLGDRYEILGAAAAALPFCIPVAHIHGGETTEGLIDEQVRHAVTKLSHLHFPVTEAYRRRVLALGESPSRVFCFGSPGLDGLAEFPFLDRKPLFAQLGVPEDARLGLITYHPVTLERRAAATEAAAVFAAAARRDDVFWLVTLPNADTENGAVRRAIARFLRRNPRNTSAQASLGRQRFLSALRLSDVMMGNSSSGIIEAPSFGLPVVNVGRRQAGRLRAANVIDVEEVTAARLDAALAKALSAPFRALTRRIGNPYQGRDTCRRIAGVLLTARLDRTLIEKRLVAR